MDKMNRPILSIAPMIDVSNTHFRNFIRFITQQATIYTEMHHHNAIEKYHRGILPFHPRQHPVVLQLGGCDPEKLAEAAEFGAIYGYDEINLNVGCPSPRVQSGSFGACLMKEPQLVFDCLRRMRERVKQTPCTVKCRLGVDQFDSYDFARDFVKEVSKEQNVDHFIIHARKAFLQGLNPAQNRNIPPLWYDRVYRLQHDFPEIKFTINGGIKTIQEAQTIISEHNVWGVMMGRTAYENPYELATADQILYGKDSPVQSREQILLKYADYVEKVERGEYFNERGPQENQCEKEREISSIKHHSVNSTILLKPILNMYHGMKGCSKYRQYLSDGQRFKKKEPTRDIIRKAIEIMNQRQKEHRQHKQKTKD